MQYNLRKWFPILVYNLANEIDTLVGMVFIKAMTRGRKMDPGIRSARIYQTPSNYGS